MTVLPISKIRTDGGTQPRAAIDFAAVDDYMDAMQEGVKFPPIVVFYDGADYWLADGFHRREAAFGAGLVEIACEVHQGTREDAQWYSFAANKTNGLRRTNEDKQRAVKAALAHPIGAGKSDREIAKHCGVSSPTVAAWREKIEPTIKVLQSAKRTGSDGRTINTANIGRASKEPGTRVNLTVESSPPVQEFAAVAQPEERPVCSGKVAGSIPVGGSRSPISFPVAPKPEPSKPDKAAIAERLRQCIHAIAAHEISAAELFSLSPDVPQLYLDSRAAFEFVGFVFDAASKRQKGIA